MNSNIRYGCMSILNEDSFVSMKASSIEKLFNRYTPKTRYGRNCSHFSGVYCDDSLLGF
jgi:hypothetical protein